MAAGHPINVRPRIWFLVKGMGPEFLPPRHFVAPLPRFEHHSGGDAYLADRLVPWNQFLGPRVDCAGNGIAGRGAGACRA